MLCVVNTLVMATSWPFVGPWSTLAKIEFLSSLVTTILVPLLTPLVMLRRAMIGGADLEPQDVGREPPVLDARQVLLRVLVVGLSSGVWC